MSTGNGNGGKLPGWVLSSTSFLSMQYRIPTIALDEYEVDAAVISLVPARSSWRWSIRLIGSRLTL